MALLDEKVKADVKKMLDTMVKPVTVRFFTQEMECGYCKETHQLLQELSELSSKIQLEVYDFVADKEMVEKHHIDKIPATVVMDEEDRGIRFFGIPAGYEFSSLLSSLLLVSTGQSKLTADTKAFLDYNQQPINLKVFVTPTCPYCPGAVILAHQMAYYSKNVTAEMIEVSEYPHIAQKYAVQGVPRTVVNETQYQEGAAPEAMIVEKIKASL